MTYRTFNAIPPAGETMGPKETQEEKPWFCGGKVLTEKTSGRS